MRSVIVALATLVALIAPSAARADGGLIQVQLTRIGAPTWKPVDMHMFSAPIGTADTGYAEFNTTMFAILPPPLHLPHPDLGVGPGAPHQPPYDHEIAAGVAAQHYPQRPLFSRSEFSNGKGVWLAWMNVPAPGTRGSSPDFARGPIIPNALFPIHVTGSSTLNGSPYSTLVDFTVPKLDGQLDPPFAVAGHSHFPTFIADNRDFGPPDVRPVGLFKWRLKLVDQTAGGWQVDAYFVVL